MRVIASSIAAVVVVLVLSFPGTADAGVPVHGNWCGPGFGDGPTTSALDAACKQHDECWEERGDFDCECDAALRDRAASIAGSTKSEPERLAALAVAAYFMSAPCSPVVVSVSVPQFKTDNVYNPCRVKLPRVPFVLETDEERCIGGSVPKFFKRSKRTEWVIAVNVPNADQVRDALERCFVVGVGAAAVTSVAPSAAAEVALAAFKGCLVVAGIDAATSLRTRERYSNWSPV